MAGLSHLVRERLETAVALTNEEVREALVGHMCRCTGYQAIVAAHRARRATGSRDERRPVLFILPILLTGILSGLAMEYEVFLVAWM